MIFVVKLRSLIIFLLAVLPFMNANAALTIEITEGVEGALPIAVVPFDWEGPGVPPEEDITGVIAADLKRSGRFAPLPKDDLLAHPHKKEDVNFQNWRILGVDNLLIGTMRGTRAGGYEIRFQLFDIFKAKQLADYSIPASAAELRFVAHQISDIVYETLTGEPGAFNTRIAYITHLKSNGKETYKLWIADADGHNPQNIFQSSHILMSPAWSSDGRQLAYVSYETGPRAGKSEVYVQDIATAKRELIAAYPGYNGAPAWSPDGKRLALTLSKIKLSDRTNYDIYI